MIAEKKYTLSEIMPGMRVKYSQLSEIFDIHILLYDVKRLENGDSEGTIGFIGKEVTSEADKFFVPGASLCPIYKEKDYYEGDVVYDE